MLIIYIQNAYTNNMHRMKQIDRDQWYNTYMTYVKYMMVRSYRDLYQKKITIYLVYNSVLILKAFSTYMLRYLISLT